MSDFPILTAITLLPLIGGVIVAGFGSEQRRLARNLALGSSSASLTLALVLWKQFNAASGELQFVERHDWIPTLGVQYFVGVDGLGLLLVMLSAIVVPMAMLASWKIEDRVPLYCSLILFLQAGLFGTFTALNFFHWFIFWELSLIPAFFLIRLWGGPERAGAATQFFVYTMVGSIAMLLGFLALFLATGTFDFFELANRARAG
jgi:NADH-quinone oxidoreductase subunit M